MMFLQLAELADLLVNVVKELISHKSRTSDDDSLHYVKVDVSQYCLENLRQTEINISKVRCEV